MRRRRPRALPQLAWVEVEHALMAGEDAEHPRPAEVEEVGAQVVLRVAEVAVAVEVVAAAAAVEVAAVAAVVAAYVFLSDTCQFIKSLP